MSKHQHPLRSIAAYVTAVVSGAPIRSYMLVAALTFGHAFHRSAYSKFASGDFVVFNATFSAFFWPFYWSAVAWAPAEPTPLEGSP